MENETNLSSLLAKSQANTKASFDKIKKVNRRSDRIGLVSVGLTAYDMVRKKQAENRAMEFYQRGQEDIVDSVNLLEDSNRFLTTHYAKFSEVDDWQTEWYKTRAEEFANQSTSIPSAGWSKSQINVIAQDMREGNLGDQYIEELEEYKTLFDLYSDPDLTHQNFGQCVSDATRDTNKARLKLAIRVF